MAAGALLCGRLEVNAADLWVLRYIWDAEDQQEVLGSIVQDAIDKSGASQAAASPPAIARRRRPRCREPGARPAADRGSACQGPHSDHRTKLLEGPLGTAGCPLPLGGRPAATGVPGTTTRRTVATIGGRGMKERSQHRRIAPCAARRAPGRSASARPICRPSAVCGRSQASRSASWPDQVWLRGPALDEKLHRRLAADAGRATVLCASRRPTPARGQPASQGPACPADRGCLFPSGWHWSFRPRAWRDGRTAHAPMVLVRSAASRDGIRAADDHRSLGGLRNPRHRRFGSTAGSLPWRRTAA